MDKIYTIHQHEAAERQARARREKAARDSRKRRR